jgi:RNA 2',3'-cyclic 3'-phosphodiesterase
VLEVSPQTQLAQLSQEIGQAIQACQYTIESRPFRAHLTLGRIKQPQGIHLEFLSKMNLPELEAIAVEEAVLFRSEPQADGSKYTPIVKIALI